MKPIFSYADAICLHCFFTIPPPPSFNAFFFSAGKVFGGRLGDHTDGRGGRGALGSLGGLRARAVARRARGRDAILLRATGPPRGRARRDRRRRRGLRAVSLWSWDLCPCPSS